MRVKLKHAKFQRFIPRGTLSNLGLNERWGVKKCAFVNAKLAISWKRREIRPMLLLIT